MALEHILQKIQDDARQKAEEILSEARAKAGEIREAAGKEAGRLAEDIRRQAERDAELEAGRLVTQARLERKLDILQCKKDLIEEVLDEAFHLVMKKPVDLKKKLVFKTGEKQESLDRNQLKENLRSEVELLAAEILQL